MGTASYSGPGAGRYPTANSVVNDIVRLGAGKVGRPFPFDKVCSTPHPPIHPSIPSHPLVHEKAVVSFVESVKTIRTGLAHQAGQKFE